MKTDIIDALASLGFFDKPTLTEHNSLLSSVSQHAYKAEAVLYQSDDESKSLFIIQEGLIKLVTHLANGRNRIVRLHKPGSMIGMDGLMNAPHEHTAIAVNDVKVFQVPHTELQRLKENEPQLYNQLLEKWYQYLNYADTWITDFSTGNIKGRVARLIEFLARFESDTGPQIVELLTTEEMSEILGVTPESVSRVVAEFKREGILSTIENNTESLFSCDLDKLKQETVA
ncbi:MAG: Crp/Fnr family transcriptional regulator [Thioalkalispiraceae bacterium]|jgi:CRP/FNR family transcriptional regulator